ncbi:hypothetical protein JHK82_040097 [Glycine max]|nr:hypothetical protein JHK82_040097 [Glycine max]KAG5122171.1 hypothetical protein JHK84_040511 [Glycine max]
MAVKGSLRFVYAHFPIKASIGNNNKSIKIRNFLGEKKVQRRGRHLLCKNNWELDCISDNVANGSSSLFPIVAAADSFFGSFPVALVSYCVSFLAIINTPRHVGARSYFEKREASLVWSYRHAGIDLFLGRLLFVLPA